MDEGEDIDLRLRLATFNIENLGRRSGERISISARKPTLQSQMTRLAADVICLQEVNAQERAADSARHFDDLDIILADTTYAGFHRAFTGARDGRGPLDIHNLVTLSRWPISRQRQFWNDLLKPPEYLSPGASNAQRIPIGWDRPFLLSEVDLGLAKPLHLFNLHLRAPIASHLPQHKRSQGVWSSVGGWSEGFFVASVKRSGQALELRLAVDQLFDADSEAWIAVAGDFNSTAQEMPVRLLRGDPEDTGNADLAGRALVPVADMAGSAAYTVVHGSRRIMLDHILVSRPLALACRKIVIDNEALLDETEPAALSARRPGSYHAPIVAEFDLS